MSRVETPSSYWRLSKYPLSFVYEHNNFFKNLGYDLSVLRMLVQYFHILFSLMYYFNIFGVYIMEFFCAYFNPLKLSWKPDKNWPLKEHNSLPFFNLASYAHISYLLRKILSVARRKMKGPGGNNRRASRMHCSK